jgi:hypothetical protein
MTDTASGIEAPAVVREVGDRELLYFPSDV